MNELQLKLMQLIKEIDKICKGSDITYYAAGGTTLGAIRHNGFLPWDDDIDIHMTYDNWVKFLQVYKKNPRKDRMLKSLENLDEHNNTIMRYLDTTTTSYTMGDVLNKEPTGIFIDIFIVDLVPKDKKAINEYLNDLFILHNIIKPPVNILRRSVSIPNYPGGSMHVALDVDEYNEYKELEKLKGKKYVVNKLLNKLNQYSSCEPTDEYVRILRWAWIPAIYEYDMYTLPSYYKFEDMDMPCQTYPIEYLKHAYGSKWMYVPKTTSQVTHDAFQDMKRPSSVYADDFKPLLDEVKVLNTYDEIKKLLVKSCHNLWNVLKTNAKIVGLQSEIALKKCIENNDIKNLFENKEYEKLEDVFKEYFDGQLSDKCINWEVFVNISDDILYTSLYTLVVAGEYDKAKRILYLRKKENKEVPENIKNIWKLILKISKMEDEYYKGNFNEAYNLKNEILNIDEDIKNVKKMDIALDTAMSKDRNDFIKVIDKIKDLHLYDDIEYIKFLGDCYFGLKEFEKAKALYEITRKNSNNGIMLLDINKKIKTHLKGVNDNKDFKDKYSKYFSCNESEHSSKEVINSDVQKKLLELLIEIDEICRKNGIKYCLDTQLAVDAVLNHEMTNEYIDGRIVMDGVNAKKFINCFNKSHKPNRVVESLLNNKSFPSYTLKYTNTDTSYFDSRICNRYLNNGICIDINILREPIASPNFLDKALSKLPFVNSLSEYTPNEFSPIDDEVFYDKNLMNFKNILAFDVSKEKNAMVTMQNSRFLDKKVIPVEKSIFVDTTEDILCGHKFYVPKDINNLLKFYNKDTHNLFTLGQKNSRFQIVNLNANCLEVYNLINEHNINLKNLNDWTKLEQDYVKKIKLLKKDKNRYFDIVWRSYDKFTLMDIYLEKKEEIVKLYKDGNYKVLEEELIPYKSKMIENYKNNLPLIFDKDIFNIMISLLEMGDDKDKKLAKFQVENIQ